MSRCERNCGAGLGSLYSEPVSLRAVCSGMAGCPGLSWSVGAVGAAAEGRQDQQDQQSEDTDPVLPAGTRGRRLIIAPPTLVKHPIYLVNLSSEQTPTTLFFKLPAPRGNNF